MVQSLTELGKKFDALFKEYLIEPDFLDVTFNLATKKCFPFPKANNKLLYINAITV